MTKVAQKQHKNSKQERIERLAPWQYKPGQSGNPGGRPVGSVSMKTYVQNKLMSMTDEEREEFLKGINKVEVWKLAEGNPANATDITSKGEQILIVPAELIDKNVPTSSTEPDSQG